MHDLVEHSEQAGDIVQGAQAGAAMAELRAFMFDNVYLGETARREHAKIERMLRTLFDYYVAGIAPVDPKKPVEEAAPTGDED